MRTLYFILGGLVLLAVCLGGARMLAGAAPDAMRNGVIAFGVAWFIVAAANMYVGVAHAGYGFLEELPIFLLIFGLPLLVAIVLKWKWL